MGVAMSRRSWCLLCGLGGPAMLISVACGGDDTTGPQPSAGSGGAGRSDATGGRANGGAAGSVAAGGGGGGGRGLDATSDASDATSDASVPGIAALCNAVAAA